MNNKKIPAITIVFYVIGIVFLAIAVFMLVTAISYTSKYVASYGATFADMWSNSLQYVISQFAPYLGLGVVCIGLGKAIKQFQGMGDEGREEPSELEPSEWANAAKYKEIEEKVNYLIENIDATREVLSIKIEEKEKRDAYRLQKMGDGLTAAFETLERKNSEPIVIEVPVAPTEPVLIAAMEDSKSVTEGTETESSKQALEEHEPSNTLKAAASEPIAVPPVFREAMTMAMPAIPKALVVPPLFREALSMAMPEIPVIKPNMHMSETPAIKPIVAEAAMDTDADTEEELVEIASLIEESPMDSVDDEELKARTFQDDMPELEAFKNKNGFSLKDMFDALKDK